MSEELNPIYYMRDDHTFKLLSGDVDTAIVEIEAEFNAGYTCGMLCSKRPGFKNIHAHGNENRFKFFAECKQALQSALTSTEHPAPLHTAPAPAVPSDELRIARGAIRELEQKVFSQEQAIAVLRASVARYQRDMEDPPAYLQDAVIRAAGLGAMAEEIAALKKKLTAAPTPPAQPAVPSAWGITDEQIDEFLYTLNDIASAYNSDEYGLPLGADDDQCQPHARMRTAIRAAFAAPSVPPWPESISIADIDASMRSGSDNPDLRSAIDRAIVAEYNLLQMKAYARELRGMLAARKAEKGKS